MTRSLLCSWMSMVPLDRLNALELINRIKEAVNQARMDIIVNFEHLKLGTPDALKALVDSDSMKVAIPGVRVRLANLKMGSRLSWRVSRS